MTVILQLGRTDVPGSPTWEAFSGDETELGVATYQKPAPGSVAFVAAYVRNTSTTTIQYPKAVLYSWDVTNSRPGDLLAIGAATPVAITDDSIWKYFPLGYTLQPNQKVAFGLVADPGANPLLAVPHASESNGRWWKTTAGAWAAPLNPFGTGGTNASGLLAMYLQIVLDDKDGPTGVFTTPAYEYAPVGGAATDLAVSAEDLLSGVASVQFRDPGGSAIGSADTSAPYATTWNTTTWDDDVYEITADLTDGSGNVRTIRRMVTIANRADEAVPGGEVRYP